MANQTKKGTQQEAQRKNEQKAAAKTAPKPAQSGAQSGNGGMKQKTGAKGNADPTLDDKNEGVTDTDD